MSIFSLPGDAANQRHPAIVDRVLAARWGFVREIVDNPPAREALWVNPRLIVRPPTNGEHVIDKRSTVPADD